MSYPRHQRARDFKFFIRGAGNLTLNSTSWADLPTIGTTWDATIQAQTGDVVEASVSLRWNNESVYSHLDVATIVSASPLNYFVSAGNNANVGVSGWTGTGTGAQYTVCGGGFPYTVVAGDVVTNLVTFRLRYRTETASNKIIIADTAGGKLMFMVKNLGPVDPN